MSCQKILMRRNLSMTQRTSYSQPTEQKKKTTTTKSQSTCLQLLSRLFAALVILSACNVSVISCMKKKKFDVVADTYLSDALSYSPIHVIQHADDLRRRGKKIVFRHHGHRPSHFTFTLCSTPMTPITPLPFLQKVILKRKLNR